MSWEREWEQASLQPENPRDSAKNVTITVDMLWPAGYSTPKTEVYEVNRWAVRDGVLILIRSEPGAAPDRTHIPLTSIARWTVSR